MTARRYLAAQRSAEGRLWTGPAAHFVGGTLDFLDALLHYALARRRRRAIR